MSPARHYGRQRPLSITKSNARLPLQGSCSNLGGTLVPPTVAAPSLDLGYLLGPIRQKVCWLGLRFALGREWWGYLLDEHLCGYFDRVASRSPLALELIGFTLDFGTKWSGPRTKFSGKPSD